MEMKIVAAAIVMLMVGSLYSDEAAKKEVSLTASSEAQGGKPVTEKKPRAYDIVKDLPDDAVFLKVGDDDILRWGDIRSCVDAMIGVQLRGLLNAPANTDGKAVGLHDIQISMYGATLSKLLRKYLMTSLVAQEAKKEGLCASEADIAADIETVKKNRQKLYAYHYQLITNLVYQRAYVDKHIRPNVKATDDEIATVIKWRHDSNLSVPLTNAIFQAKIVDLRNRIAEGTLEFAEAAEEHSECTECCSNNGDCGPWEEDLDDLDPALKAFCFSAPVGALSEVIEGKDAYHIVKIKSRYVPTQKARDEDGEVSSVEVKHLQIDKWSLDPEFTRDTAAKFITEKKIVFELTNLQEELREKAKIESILPLYDTRKNRAKTFKVNKKMLRNN